MVWPATFPTDGWGVPPLRQRCAAGAGSGDSLLTRNRIFMDRTVGIGAISKEMAIANGLTGPESARLWRRSSTCARTNPYLIYENYDFDVPIGTTGDCYDRYLMRAEEIRQSVRIVRQVIEKFPDGPYYAEAAKKIFSPPKARCSPAWRN